MNTDFKIFTRRRFMLQCVLGASLWQVSGLMAETLTQTPKQTEGPFYPDNLPLDTDNDLLVINDSINPGVGQVTWLSGRILDAHGLPVRNALVEIWQCDAKGVYYHSGSGDDLKRRDTNFQCFGRFLTGSKGEYVFRTIKPVPYPGRTPHIHFKVKCQGKELLTTQCYIKGHPQNEKDGIWKRITDQKQRENVTVNFDPIPGSKLNELTANFDVILGWTPESV